MTGQLRVNPECQQRAARRLPPHSPPLRRRMRLRARGARSEPAPAEPEPAEPAAPPSAPPDHGSATLPNVANAARASFQATGVRRHRDHAEGGERHRFHHIACYRRGVTPDQEDSTPSDRLESSRSGGILSAVQASTMKDDRSARHGQPPSVTRAHLPTHASPTDTSPTDASRRRPGPTTPRASLRRSSVMPPGDVRDQPHRRPGLTPNQHAMFYHPMVEATQHTPI